MNHDTTTEEEMERFLAGDFLARIATVNPDGSPHVTPVWFLWENKELVIVSYRVSGKVTNIGKDNRVTVVIDSYESWSPMSGKGVIVEGRAKISGDSVREITRKVSAKYVKPEKLEDYVESVLKDAVVIKVTPRRMVLWDYSKSDRLQYLEQH